MLIVLAAHLFILHNVFGFSWELVLADAIISTVVISISIWGIVMLIRAYPTTAAVTLYALFIGLFMSAATVAAEYEAIKWWVSTPATKYYTDWLLQTLPVRFLVIWIFSTWAATISAFRKNMAALDVRFQQQTDAAALLREAELFKLRQQLQPHFLYNSLNSINALILISPERAQNMVGKLSEFLRSSVKRESDDTIPISEELVYIQSYLDIESVRFGDRLVVNFTHENTEHATIPPFLLQPILENAIKFGLYGKTGKVQIDIHMAVTAGMLTLTIVNPYDPDMQPPRGTGFGLSGIRRRLFLVYGRTDLLDTQKDNTTFTTTLKIPQQYVQSNTDR